MKRDSKLTCPKCGFVETIMMPIDQCVIVHNCSNCKAVIHPESGDCCVFCSFGDTPCPPMQLS
ncbi:MAG: GDCCVxC domain-containing (seleno)protein [Candidatus Hodarchaeota archaeon]